VSKCVLFCGMGFGSCQYCNSLWKIVFFSSISLFNALLSASGRSYIMISIVFIVVFNNLCHCQRFCNVHEKHCLISVTISILHNQAEKTT